MAPLYKILCEELKVTPDAGQLNKMAEANAKRIKEIEAEIADSEANLGQLCFDACI